MADITWNSLLAVLTLTVYLVLAQGTCIHNEREYQVGDSITGDPCDKCTCTQFGIMCELIYCNTTLCVDKFRPEGQCCEVCPNGINCLYFGDHGPVLVPASGCKYAGWMECYCYYVNGDPEQSRTYCLPPLPFMFRRHGALPVCHLRLV